MARKGVSWNVGKVFFHDDLVYQFDLLPEEGHKMPAMINLQQYYLEEFLVEACDKSGLVDLRWKHKLISIRRKPTTPGSRWKRRMASSSWRRTG